MTPLSLFLVIIDHTLYYYGIVSLVGLIGIILGFRVILFSDVELMSRWNALYFVLFVITVLVIISISFIVFLD